MKKVITIAILSLTLTLFAFASQTTVTGVLTDDMCTKKHMMPGRSNADCVRDCIKHGAKFVVIGDGKAVEIKANPEQIAEFAGMKVKATGTFQGKVLAVKAIEAAQ